MKKRVYNVSVIIPYRNTVNYLSRALDSALIYGCNDVQVIVVNDNSNENLNEYKKLVKKYKNSVEFYESTNGRGAGVARNIGLEHARGKWILFLDTDDEFTNEWYGIVKKYFNSNYDIVYFQPTSEAKSNTRTGNRHLRYKRRVENYLKNSSQRNEDKLRYEFIVPWSKLIRKDLILNNNIKFEEVMYGNDNMFSVRIGNLAKEIFASNEIIYKVSDMSNSLTKNKSFDAIYQREQVHCRRYNYIKKEIGVRRFNELDICVFVSVDLCKVIARVIKGKYEYKSINKFIALHHEQNIRPFPPIKYIIHNFGRLMRFVLRIDKVY